MNDWALISDFVQGNEQALDGLIQKYFPSVYAAAVRQLGDHHLAQDVAQSVFVLFSRKAVHLSQGVHLGGWLLRTTRFICRDVMKQMKRRALREQAAVQMAEISLSEPAWTTLAPFVDDALNALPGKEQECVIARFIEGRSLRDIGAQHGISEDAAQKRVSRGVEKMRLFLQRRGVKTGVVGLAAMLTAELSRGAESGLVDSAIAGVHSALKGTAVSSAGLQLANAAARKLLLARMAQIAASSFLTVALVVTGGVIWRDRAIPAVPAAPPFRTTPAIEALGSQWARLSYRAAVVVRSFSPQPTANDPGFAAFQSEVSAVSDEGNRIRAAFQATSPPGVSPTQLAQFLTVELREGVGLTERQQAAVYVLLRDELESGATPRAGRQALIADKAQLGEQIRAWLSPYQRRRFNFIYREDFLGLFTFVKIQ